MSSELTVGTRLRQKGIDCLCEITALRPLGVGPTVLYRVEPVASHDPRAVTVESANMIAARYEVVEEETP